MMKSRMRHFFGPDGRAFVLAMDHAALMPSPALKDPGHVAREAAAGGVDAFLATFGIVKGFRPCGDHFERGRGRISAEKTHGMPGGVVQG